MSNKENKKHKKEESVENKPLMWEDLSAMRLEAVEFAGYHQKLLDTIMKDHADLLKEDEGIRRIMSGVFKSLNDVAKTLKTNMDFHMKIDENGNLIEQKTGVVSDDEYLDFLKIGSNYNFALEQLSSISASGFQELLTTINSKKNMVDQKDIEQIKEVYKDSIINLAKDMGDTIDGTTEQKSKSK